MPDEKSVFVNDEANINKVIKPVPKPEKEIGIDTKEYIFQNIINAGTASALNVGEIERFTSVSRGREQVYKMLDAMGDDSKIAAVLETYAEDATEYNDKGRIVWVESSDSNIAAYVEFLLNSLCIDKNVYKWMYSLCKYGDVYLRLYRKSEYTDLLFNPPKVKEEILNDGLEKNGVIDGVSERKTLTENVKIKAYAPNDKYVHYVEMVPNPAEVFELTRFGKTAGYIKTSINAQPLQQPNNELRLLQQLYRYSFKQKDVELYSATEFVHACLDDGSNRTPEEVEIFLDPSTVETYKDYNPTGSTSSDGSSSGSSTSYSVKRGQSILYSSYKVWRELQLLETSVLLNRVTQSSISRIIQVEVGDMPKEMVGPHMQGIKQMIEQKAAINVGTGLDEYTAAGPIINNIYVPTHDGKGAISATAIGGDYKPGELVDLDYYLNCLYGGLRVPKQFFCLRGNTPILLLDGTTHTIQELFENRDAFIGKGIISCAEDGTVSPTTIANIMLTKEHANFIRVHLDNGEYVDVTPEHRMMLRDGSFVEAQNLQPGDSLMPYYDRVVEGRRQVLDNKLGKYIPQFHLVGENMFGDTKGMQIHHKNTIKSDDDFSNLELLTPENHCRVHNIALHAANKLRSAERRKNGEHNKHFSQKCINNGIFNCWINANEELPDGFTYGMLRTTTEEEKHEKAIAASERFKNQLPWCAGKTKENDIKVQQLSESVANFHKINPKHFYTNGEVEKLFGDTDVIPDGFVRGRLASSLTNCREKSLQYAWVPENRRRTPHYVRCACCGEIKQINCNADWYSDYLNMDDFYYCSKECSKLNARGKLKNSYKLFKASDKDIATYEQHRTSGLFGRRDTYFKAEKLAEILTGLQNYVPEVNHQVVKLERLDVDEPAYDIEVISENHTFALPCGIFVHNCQTDDATGFNGGTSLSIISSRYAKAIKRIQNVMCQAITDIVNLMLLDNDLGNYINGFEIKMLPPTTQDEKDRRENISTRVQLVRDVMDLLSDIDDKTVKMKVLKAQLATALSNQELNELLDAYVQQLEADSEEAEPNEAEAQYSDSNGGGEYDASAPIDLDSGSSDTDELTGEMSPSDDGGSSDLPSASDLGMDFTDSTQF